MSDSQPRPISSVSLDTSNALEWKCHPVTRKPLISAGVCVLIIVITLIVLFSTQSIGFTALALVMLFASLAKFFFPTKYRLDDSGVTVKTMTQTLTKPWSTYRSFYADKNGILLSPFPEPTRLENFRGLYVMFAQNSETVIAYIRKYIPSAPAEGSAS